MAADDHNIIDYEEVLRVLPEAFRESWKNNPDVLVYLSDLGSLGIQRLVQEPERLSEEKCTVLEHTQDLAFHNYKTFIQAAECSHTIFKDFNVIESRLDALLKKLPDFKTRCGEFGKEAQMINTRWRQASSTLSKHPQLLEILEIPQLMNNCVRECLYDDALELSSYVKRLERKNLDIALIKCIIQEVQGMYNVMLVNLLSKLQTNIQLPECLKIVGYLRRMDVFNEMELRIKFLQSRDVWFQKVINDIPKHDPYDHVTKVIENSRIHLFDITTQYRAIFSDDDPLMLAKEDSKNNSVIFHSWITWKLSWFLSILKKDFSGCLSGKIDSLLTQCMYFGLSFSRVNIDFRPLLVPIFEKAAFQQFNIALKKAIYNFESTMKSFTFSMYSSPTFATLPEESLQPPISLLDFYPLAQYYNEILAALNELKLCCSYSISINVIAALTTSLKQVVKILVTIHAKKNRIMNESENDNFNRLCILFSTDLVTHLNKCLNVIFPPDGISQVLGLTTLEFMKLEHLCKLDLEDILQPLQVILPSRDDDFGLVIAIRSSENKDEQNQVMGCQAEVDMHSKFEQDLHLPSEPSIESVASFPSVDGTKIESLDVISKEKESSDDNTKVYDAKETKDKPTITLYDCNTENTCAETEIIEQNPFTNSENIAQIKEQDLLTNSENMAEIKEQDPLNIESMVEINETASYHEKERMKESAISFIESDGTNKEISNSEQDELSTNQSNIIDS